jgi:hypothetical protein
MKVKNNKRSARTSPKKVHIKKAAKGLTSQAGLVPAIKFLQKHMSDNITQDTVKHKRGDSALYDSFDVIFLSIIGIIGGARSISAIVQVWSDGILCRIAGWVSIPYETTFGRIFRTFTQAHIDQMETLNHRLRTRIWKHALRCGKSRVGAMFCHVIDVDSTEKTTYGKQQGAAKGFNPHKRGAVSYHPLLAFCTETKEILQGWLRCGNAYTSNGIVEFTKQLLAHLPNKKTIFFRGDSGFFGGKLLDLLDLRGHKYLIKVKLKGLVRILAEQTWEAVPGQSGWEQCEFEYQCGTWNSSRRFVAVRQEKKQDPKTQATLFEVKQYDYFCYVVSEYMDPWTAHKFYGQRATCETWIEEAKNQMGLAHIKTDDFWASSALFQCAILAYNTVRWMALCSGDKLLRRWEPATVRTFLIRVAGRLTVGGNQQKINVPNEMLYEAQWDAWVDVGLTP